MRLILTLVTILLFSFKVTAKVGLHQGIKINRPMVEMQLLPLHISKPTPVVEIKTAILYKMKENIIRRELSFTPKKKWMKWV